MVTNLQEIRTIPTKITIMEYPEETFLSVMVMWVGFAVKNTVTLTSSPKTKNSMFT